MPVCRVAPSGMNRRAFSAIASSVAFGSGEGRANGAESDGTRMSA